MQDYYKILGVDKSSSDDEIKKAYRKLAQKNHPDKNPGDKASETKFKEATEAYETLSDKQKRQQYDMFGSSSGNSGGGGGFSGTRGNGANFSQGFDFSDLGGFADVFESFFGGNTGGRSARGGNAPMRGGDIEALVNLDFMEAVNGTSRDVEIEKPVVCETCKGKRVANGSKMQQCSQCHGSGQVRKMQRTMLGNISTVAACDACHGAGEIPEKVCQTCNGASRVKKTEKLSIKIPAGVDNGSTVRVSEKGEGGINGGPSGELFIHIRIKEDSHFKRNGSDVHTAEGVSLLQAVLGDKINVKTIYGNVKLNIPTGTQSGQIFKLSEYGFTKPATTRRGDQYIEVEVEIPKKLSKKEKELYEELAKESGMDLKGKKGFFN
ncbi:MAG: molecular chaperone DnaJ [Candidatus Peregrinibacteria bacterium]|nr:molecular chaperone DnaJ [Candidatus Peregrinibacteria bacterium]MDZ4244725.1 molecular chaperone DnaJ [Candidatus Gracilibacteria bacterium]